jgi:hypothetical protein
MDLNPHDPDDDELTREFFRGCFPAWFVDFYLCRDIYLASFEGSKRTVVWALLWLLDIGIAVVIWAIGVTLLPPDLYFAFLQSILVGFIGGYLLVRYWCRQL